MNKKVNILRTRPLVATSLSILLFSICSYHYLTRVGINLQILIALSALTVLISLTNEAKSFFISIAKEPRKYFLIICILVSAIGGLIINVANIIEISFFIILFLLVHLIFINKDNDLINLVTKLVICSGVFMSVGVLTALFESIFLSSKLFYHIADGYPAISDQKYIYSGFGFNQNYSAYIIVIALSFLFLSQSTLSRKLRNYLTLLFTLALLITAARIMFLLFSLIACNYFIKTRTNTYLMSAILISLYLFFSHILIGVHGNYELGSIHYREVLFSIGNVDFVLGHHGHMKLTYFAELKENFFFPVSLSEMSQSLTMDPHSLVFSLIILGGVPLALSVVMFLILEISKNLPFIEQNYSKFYYCGLISIITETFMWDASNSIFFWIIILYAITISKDSCPPDNISG
jgi:hypothetical protein